MIRKPIFYNATFPIHSLETNLKNEAMRKGSERTYSTVLPVALFSAFQDWGLYQTLTEGFASGTLSSCEEVFCIASHVLPFLSVGGLFGSGGSCPSTTARD